MMSENQNADEDDQNWYLDSGATRHMTPFRGMFSEFRDLPTPRVIFMGDNTQIEAVRIRKVPFLLDNGARGFIRNVLYVPKLSKSLLMMGAINDEGFSIEFRDGNCVIERNESMVAEGTRGGGLYKLQSMIDTRKNVDSCYRGQGDCLA